MLLMFKARINKPADMSNKDFYTVWRKEAEAALGAKEAGVIKGIWKVAGKPEVVVIMEVESGDMLDQGDQWAADLAARLCAYCFQTLKCFLCVRTRTGPKI